MNPDNIIRPWLPAVIFQIRKHTQSVRDFSLRMCLVGHGVLLSHVSHCRHRMGSIGKPRLPKLCTSVFFAAGLPPWPKLIPSKYVHLHFFRMKGPKKNVDILYLRLLLTTLSPGDKSCVCVFYPFNKFQRVAEYQHHMQLNSCQ